MNRELLDVRSGVLSFDRFVATTRLRWLSLGNSLLRKWSVPRAVTVEDVLQELLIAAWTAIEQWDPNRSISSSIERFVVWQAVAAAKRWIHVQRGARHATYQDREPGVVIEPEKDGNTEVSIAAEQDRVVEALERIQLATRLVKSNKQKTIIRIFVETASVDATFRRMCETRPDLSRLTVLRTLRHVAAQMEN